MNISDFVNTVFMVFIIGPFALLAFATFIYAWALIASSVGCLLLKPCGKMDDHI